MPHHLHRQGVTWLYFPFPAAKGVASDLAEWETRLVAGAFRDGSAQRGLPGVIGTTQRYPGFGPSEGFFGPTNSAIRDGNAGHLIKLLTRHEGLFFEVLNSKGKPVYFYAHTTRVEG